MSITVSALLHCNTNEKHLNDLVKCAEDSTKQCCVYKFHFLSNILRQQCFGNIKQLLPSSHCGAL